MLPSLFDDFVELFSPENNNYYFLYNISIFDAHLVAKFTTRETFISQVVYSKINKSKLLSDSRL